MNCSHSKTPVVSLTAWNLVFWESETDSVIPDERLARITELCDFLKEQPSEITVFE